MGGVYQHFEPSVIAFKPMQSEFWASSLALRFVSFVRCVFTKHAITGRLYVWHVFKLFLLYLIYIIFIIGSSIGMVVEVCIITKKCFKPHHSYCCSLNFGMRQWNPILNIKNSFVNGVEASI